MEQVAGLAMQQTLSPQMQQSLSILQAPLTELRQMVEQELRENPALEEKVPEPVEAERVRETDSINSEWNEYFAQRAVADPWTRDAQERRQHFFDSQAREPTLQEHLLEQVYTASWPRDIARIAVEIIGNLDEQGYLRADVEDIAYATDVRPLEVEEVLEQVQEFDPPGIAARNLAECLLLQLRRMGLGESLESDLVRNHLEALGRKRLLEISKELNVPVTDVQQAAARIAKLDPRPGRAFSAVPEQIIVPEVVVERDGEDYTVRLNSDEVPQLRISDAYKDLVSSDAREVREYLREKIKGGRFLIKCIHQRQETILAIAREIVTRQREFFEHGPEALKPLTMSQVADAVGVHETTVSRAASGKYMQTPRGIFEMKYFFTHGYTNSEGEAVSNESVRQAIQVLVRDEDPSRPLSDQAIVAMLAERGLTVARRTVAKYREQLGILPSHLRKAF
ncbi:MAG: RNA polymerase factor sigma-54 [Terrimicrobiaceae bacterium]|nr:RNA polymerase factor sigma-54 [Terrimicrobiaceae bacterium]